MDSPVGAALGGWNLPFGVVSLHANGLFEGNAADLWFDKGVLAMMLARGTGARWEYRSRAG
jgi:hypothetical protein